MVMHTYNPHRRVLFRCDKCNTEYEVIDPGTERRTCMRILPSQDRCRGEMKIAVVEEFQ